MKIRKAALKDVHAIHRLILSATKRGKILKRPTQEITQSIHHFRVAEENGEVVACCAVEIYNRKLSEIRSLVVDSKHERKGIATALIKRSIAEAKKKNVYEVLAITDKESLFKRLGFSEQLHGQKPLFTRP